MIISIEISVAQVSGQPITKSEDFFSEVLRSSRRGHHIVIVPRPLARWAEDNLHLSGADLAHLERVREEFTQLGSLRAAPTSRVIRVVSFQQDLEQISEQTWSIGVEEILASSFLEQTVLLLENATNDGDLYKELLSHEARRRGIRNLAYQINNGGGSTTFQEVSRLANLKHIIVCICDNDRLSPYGQMSETFRKAKASAKTVELLGTIIDTPGREAENFLPLDIIADLFPKYDAAEKQKLEGLLAAQGTPQPGDCFWLYFDVKEGVCSKRFVKKCDSDEARHWIATKYQIDDLDEDDTKIDGFGQNVIKQLLANGASLSELHRFTRSPYWQKHFETWFDSILPFLQSRSNSRI